MLSASPQHEWVIVLVEYRLNMFATVGGLNSRSQCCMSNVIKACVGCFCHLNVPMSLLISRNVSVVFPYNFQHCVLSST